MRLHGPRLLVVLGAAAVLAVLVSRSCSTFAAVARRAGEARAVAARTGLRTEQVMALLDLDTARDAGALVAAAGELREAADRLGDLALAVAATQGQGALVEELLAAAGGDASVARARLLAHREGLVATRFLSMTERYAEWLARR